MASREGVRSLDVNRVDILVALGLGRGLCLPGGVVAASALGLWRRLRLAGGVVATTSHEGSDAIDGVGVEGHHIGDVNDSGEADNAGDGGVVVVVAIVVIFVEWCVCMSVCMDGERRDWMPTWKR
jgi:hypothetical protein